MSTNSNESCSNAINLDNNQDSEPAMSELVEKTELDSPRDLAKSPSRSRNASVNRNSDSYSEENSSRKRKRRSSDRSPSRKVHCGRHRSRHSRERDGKRYGSAGRDNSKPSRCLGVFGLSWDTRENDLYKIFASYGEVEKLTVVRRFAFVYYENIEDAKLAKEQCRGIRVNGKIIRIDYSRTEQPQGSERSRYNSSRNRNHSRNGNYKSRSGSPRYYSHRRRS